MKVYPFEGIYPNPDLIPSPESFFGSVKHDYTEYYENGFFLHAKEKAFYILEITTETKTHTGIIACLKIEDYSKGKIVKHEQTIATSEQAMLKLILLRGAMVKPVLLSHPEIKDLTKELKRLKKKRAPFSQYSLSEGAIIYTLYQIPESEGEHLAKIYNAHLPKVYIADGHHRCSTGEKLLHLQGDKKGFDYSLILAALFSFDQLDVLDYNRVVELPYHLKLTRFIAELSHYFDIQILDGPAKPQQKHELTMVMQEDWFLLKWKPEVLSRYKKTSTILDAHLLDKEIFEGILGVTNVLEDKRVSYISGIHGPQKIEEIVRESEHHVGFCIYPVQFPEIVRVSDYHETLPPKSTWFEPRMINGLIVKSY